MQKCKNVVQSERRRVLQPECKNAEEYSSLNAIMQASTPIECRNAEEYSSLKAACRGVLQTELGRCRRVLKLECKHAG
jgi:hypothetical protein